MAIIETYINEGNSTEAVLLLDDMEQNGNLNINQQNVFNHFRSIKELELLLLSENRHWPELDSLEIAQLEIIANGDFALATAQAQSILSYHYGYQYDLYFDLPEENASENQDEHYPTQKEKKELSLSVFPIPAKGHITLAFEQPLIHNTILTITDLNGKTVKVSPLNEGGLQFQISIRELPIGIYHYQVILNGENKTGKIVTTK